VSAAAFDTIVAPATPVGRSALAVVRIDGPLTNAIADSLTGGSSDARIAVHRYLSHNGELLDDCVVIRYFAPHSFTGNDLAELTLHGNPLLVERVISAIVDLGARIAEPGEFTERAVLNGKLDLVQAESIADLIAARTSLQAKLSLTNLRGALSEKAAAIRESLLFVISRLEAALDFSEEGYDFIGRDEARAKVEEAIRACRAIAETWRRGRATASGLNLVILGRPNAGKSTLLNRLVGSERAIVTPIPGTTRDIVRETIEIGGLPVTIADTAGLRESSDVVEGIGIERAREAAAAADIVLYLIDSTSGLADEDERELSSLSDPLIVRTKTDLPASFSHREKVPEGRMRGVSISAKSDTGVADLLTTLDQLVRDRFAAPESSATIVNERQRQAIASCEDALMSALHSLDSGYEEPIVVVDLYRAANALGLLTGAITNDEILTEIFSKFCIGK